LQLPNLILVQISKTKEECENFFNSSNIEITHYIATSINSSETIESLKDAINECARRITPKIQKRCYVLRADRIFSVKGFGTVVTGTSIFGQISKDSLIYNISNGKSAKVKNIQVHDRDVDKSVAGERTAINLPELSAEDIDRGDILSDNKKIKATKGIYANISIYSDLQKDPVIKHNKTYSIYIGSNVFQGKIIFYDRKKLKEGEEAQCFIKLDKKIVPYFDEPIIIRTGSPQISVAGGRILGVEETYPDRKFTREIMAFLAAHDYDSALKKIVEIFHCGIEMPEPIQFSGLIRNELAAKLAQLNIANFEGFILDNKNLDDFVESTLKELNSKGSLAMSKIQHTCSKLPDPVRFDIINRIIERAQKQDFIFDGHILKKHEKDPFEEMALKVLSLMKQDAKLSNSAQLATRADIPEQKIVKCLQYLRNRSLIKNVEGNNHVTMELVNSFVDKAVKEGENGTGIDLKVMREHFDLPRKLLVPLMDSLDKTGLFINKDNKRYLKK
jgi:selenocysteine-specific elongation factor